MLTEALHDQGVDIFYQFARRPRPTAMRLFLVSATCFTIAVCAQTRTNSSSQPQSKSQVIDAPWPSVCELIDVFTGDYKDIESSIRVDAVNWINAVKQLILKRIEQVKMRRNMTATAQEKAAIDMEYMQANDNMRKMSKIYQSCMKASEIKIFISKSKLRQYLLSAISMRLRLPLMHAPQLQVLISNLYHQWSYLEALLQHIEAYEHQWEKRFYILHFASKHVLEAFEDISIQLECNYRLGRTVSDNIDHLAALTNVHDFLTVLGPQFYNAQINMLHATFVKNDLQFCAYVLKTIVENAIILYAAAN